MKKSICSFAVMLVCLTGGFTADSAAQDGSFQPLGKSVFPDSGR
ncbi:hypothetical protein P9D54_14265 [Bacillus haynesii]|nr:hypothetical protein [Bacillus haynesii]MEC1346533.1 hypothetical protein [Bacillus haynesii]